MPEVSAERRPAWPARRLDNPITGDKGGGVIEGTSRRGASARRVARAVALGILVSALVTLLSRIGVFAGWEARAVDTFVFLRERRAGPEIVLVAIDDDDFQRLGERQPLPRDYLADLAEFLLESGARVVAMDIAARVSTDPAADARLVAVSERAAGSGRGRLVFAGTARPRTEGGTERYAMAEPFSAALRARLGFSNAPVGSEGVIRRMTPVLPSVDGGFLPSFALAALAGWDEASSRALDGALRSASGALVLPIRIAGGGIDERRAISVAALSGAPWRVDFAGPPGTITAFPSGPLVQMARSGVKPGADNPFAGRIAIIGATFAESRDSTRRPRDSWLARRSRPTWCTRSCPVGWAQLPTGGSIWRF